jgi:hypothetical protein
VQIIITSHDPLTLSDIPKNNIVFLEKTNQITKVANSYHKRTLGANISDLLKDSFFMEDGQMGSFISNEIDQIIDDIKQGQLSIEKKKRIERIIFCIDEPIIRFKLAEMLSATLENKEFEIEIIDDE